MWSKLRVYIAFAIIKGSLILVLLIGVSFVILVLQRYKTDTTHITNVAFGLTAVLASLSFSCSRALSSDDKDRDKFTYAGERFMHASIELITASILKYAFITLQATSYGQAHSTLIGWVMLPLTGVGSALFMLAVLDAHTGLQVCTNLLYPRMTRYDEHRRLY